MKNNLTSPAMKIIDGSTICYNDFMHTKHISLKSKLWLFPSQNCVFFFLWFFSCNYRPQSSAGSKSPSHFLLQLVFSRFSFFNRLHRFLFHTKNLLFIFSLTSWHFLFKYHLKIDLYTSVIGTDGIKISSDKWIQKFVNTEVSNSV